MEEILRIKTLGGFEACLVDGTPLTFESDKTRLLLVYLGLETGHPHRREHLAGLFWPDKTSAQARHSLSQALYAMRATLQKQDIWAQFEVDTQTLYLHPDNRVWLDAAEFNTLARAYDQHNHPQAWICRSCQSKLKQALDLYSGNFLAGLSLPGCQDFEAWISTRRQSLHQQAVQVCERLVRTLEVQQELEQALEYALRWTALDPLDEAGHRQVMLLYSRSGKRAEALAQYALCREILQAELEVEPEVETTLLFHEISRQTESVQPASVRHNLPTPLTRLVGRQIETDNLCLKMTDPNCRLLTVLGQGGIGKTRLALEAGHRLLPFFRDGVFLVELDTQSPSQDLILRIAQDVGYALYSDADLVRRSQFASLQEQLSDYLVDKNMLLIIDGFEGLLEQADTVASLLRHAPGLKVLVSSRARLDLKGEQVFLVGSLPYPQAAIPLDDLSQFASVQLFIEAARRSKPDFELTDQNQAAVMEICQLNQGLPLGILLAAAWVGALSPEQIAQEIKRSLDFLSAGWRDLPIRQRSLRMTFDHSWRLLSETEQKAFLCLSIFRSPFSVPRARQVADVSLHTLKTLVHQSLLQPTGEDRYRMHDLLRQYAQEKLAALPELSLEVHERHCQTFLEALAAWEPPLKSQAQFAALAEMDRELTDIRLAWDWAVQENKTELLSGCARALGYYYELHMQTEPGFSAFEPAVSRATHGDLAGTDLLAWARLGNRLAYFSFGVKGYPEAWNLFEQIDRKLQAAESKDRSLQQVHAETHYLMGRILSIRSQWTIEGARDLPQALSLLERSLTEMSACGSEWDVAAVLVEAALCTNYLGNIRQNQQFSEEALALEVGDPNLTVNIEVNLGYVYMLTGDYQKAIKIVESQNSHRRRVGSPGSRAGANLQLGLAHYYAGRYAEARVELEEACTILSLPRHMPSIRFARYILYIIDLYTGDYPAVRQGTAWKGMDLGYFQPACGIVKGLLALADGDYQTAEIELNDYLQFVIDGKRMDMPGMALALLGWIAFRRGELEAAFKYLVQALENGLQQGFFLVFNLALSVLALILVENEELEGALELYATAITHPMVADSPLFRDLFGRRIIELTAALPPEVLQAAQKRGRGRDLYTVGQAWLERLTEAGDLLAALSL